MLLAKMLQTRYNVYISVPFIDSFALIPEPKGSNAKEALS